MRNSTNDRARAERTSKEWNDKHMLKKKQNKKKQTNRRTDEQTNRRTIPLFNQTQTTSRPEYKGIK